MQAATAPPRTPRVESSAAGGSASRFPEVNTSANLSLPNSAQPVSTNSASATRNQDGPQTPNTPSGQPTKYLGVTPPISTATPSTFELEATSNLVQTLNEMGQFEPEASARKREVVLGKLNLIVKSFVTQISIKRGMPEAIARQAGGKIFTFGSYRLGVHSVGADIDTLCVVPRQVQREDFFETLVANLKERPEVTDLTPVPDAYVPVIKMEFAGIPIDLVFARLTSPSIPDDLDLKDDNLLKGLDERCVRSLNGSRVTDQTLRLVPNVEEFRLALRCIKLWAKTRAIYSNVLGFLGGVAWQMLVARVCQLYPNATAGAIVSKFFTIVLQWNWPQPVLLKPIEDGPLQVRVWNPKLYAADRQHRMPIITPAYPSMCATHNVTASTQTILTSEFKRAAEIVGKIFRRKATWSELFQKQEFFTKYKRYLRVMAMSNSQERQMRYQGMVESRMRQLVMKLETVEDVVLAHPYVKNFESKVYVKDVEEALRGTQYPEAFEPGVTPIDNSLKAGSETPQPLSGSTTEPSSTPAPAPGTAKDPSSTIATGTPVASPQTNIEDSKDYPNAGYVYVTSFYMGLPTESKLESTGTPTGSATNSAASIAANGPSASPKPTVDLSWSLGEFENMIKSWDAFDPESMAIVISLKKASKLPEEALNDIPEHLRQKPKKTSKSLKRTRSVPERGGSLSSNAESGSKRKRASSKSASSLERASRKKLKDSPQPVVAANGDSAKSPTPSDRTPVDKSVASSATIPATESPSGTPLPPVAT